VYSYDRTAKEIPIGIIMNSSKDASTRRKTGRAGHKASAARLAAVQALYEIDLTGAESRQVVSDFVDKRWRSVTLRDPDSTPGEGGKARLPNPDPDFLRTIVDGVNDNSDDLNKTIEQVLEGEWTLERLDALMRNLLRAGAYEMTHMPNVPDKTILSEYGDLAHTFFDEKDAKFANGVLHNLIKLIRPAN
jgi:N utilization substance protein B